MTSDPWIKFFPSDWLGGTSGLTAAERGVYITILALVYETGGPIKMDRARLARRCGVPAGSFKRILTALLDEGKLFETEVGLSNSRAEKELGEREIAHTKRQSGARKTNAILAEKRQQKQGGDERSASRSANANTRSQKPEVKDTPNGVSKKKQGTRLPEDWVLPRDWGDWALAEGWTENVIRDQADRFRDYWISKTGRDATKRDWLATWRNWMRNAKIPRVIEGKKSHGSNLLAAAKLAADAYNRQHGLVGGADSDPSQPLLPTGPRQRADGSRFD